MGAEMATRMLQIAAQSQVTGSGQLGMEIHLGAARIILAGVSRDSGDDECAGFRDKQVITLTHLAGAPLDISHDGDPALSCLGALDLLHAHNLALVDVPQVKLAA